MTRQTEITSSRYSRMPCRSNSGTIRPFSAAKQRDSALTRILRSVSLATTGRPRAMNSTITRRSSKAPWAHRTSRFLAAMLLRGPQSRFQSIEHLPLLDPPSGADIVLAEGDQLEEADGGPELVVALDVHHDRPRLAVLRDDQGTLLEVDLVEKLRGPGLHLGDGAIIFG